MLNASIISEEFTSENKSDHLLEIKHYGRAREVPQGLSTWVTYVRPWV
jgi:hypothetical protein